jgi:hypothetical protein
MSGALGPCCERTCLQPNLAPYAASVNVRSAEEGVSILQLDAARYSSMLPISLFQLDRKFQDLACLLCRTGEDVSWKQETKNSTGFSCLLLGA